MKHVSKYLTPHIKLSSYEDKLLERLKQFYEKIDLRNKIRANPKIYRFSNHPFLESCLASLIPYFDLEGTFPEHIASLKITEAISILREIDPNVDGILANFDEPGKIDLISFMERNFMFNMPLEKLGYLTGRSLSTFNRDLKKISTARPKNGSPKKGSNSLTIIWLKIRKNQLKFTLK